MFALQDDIEVEVFGDPAAGLAQPREALAQCLAPSLQLFRVDWRRVPTPSGGLDLQV